MSEINAVVRPYQAIVTKYAGPTNSRGSRIIVRAQAGRMIVAWDHALNPSQNHAAAARAFAEKWGWNGAWFMGANPGDSGYTFVVAGDENPLAAFVVRGHQ